MILNREEKRYRALGLKIDMQEHGDKRWFTDADGEKRQYRPRWFWIGPKRLHNKVSVKDQLWYYKVLSGAKQQVRDEDSRKRRKAGHMDWVLGNDTFEREEFESKELRPILDKIREKKKAHAHLEEIDIEDMLKLIAINSFFPEEESESMIDQQEEGEQQEAPMFHDPLSQDGILPPEVSPSPPKRPRLSEPDEDDPGEARWKLEYLRTLNGKRLAYLELLHFVASQESDVNHDDPVERSQAMDNNIKDITGKKLELASFSETMVKEICRMSNSGLHATGKNIKKARQEYAAKLECFRPKEDMLLIQHFALSDAFEGLSADEAKHALTWKFSLKENGSGGPTLKGEAAEMLRNIHYNIDVPLSRVPALISTIAPLFLGRTLEKDELVSATTLRDWMTRLDLIDRYDQQALFVKLQTLPDEDGNPLLYYTCDDDSTHNSVNATRHVCLVTVLNSDGSSSFRLATCKQALTKTSEGNADLNAFSILELLGDRWEVRYLYGGGTTDNASDAVKTVRLTFEKLMATLPIKKKYQNGVLRQPIHLGDGFHIANLVVQWASLGAFGETTKGEHQEKHHRQMVQSLYDGINENRQTARLIELEIAAEYGLEVVPHVVVVRERQQRWMVNQRQCANILNWYDTKIKDKDGKETSFLLEFCSRLSLAVRSKSEWKANAIDHAATLVAMPEIRVALQFEAENGQYFNTVMEFHALPGRFSDRPGFRMLGELHEFFFNFELVYWKEARADPRKSYPLTFKRIDEIDESKVLQDGTKVRELKVRQVESGIEGGYHELLKMSAQYFKPDISFLMLTLGVQGPCFMRALAKRLSSDEAKEIVGELKDEYEEVKLANPEEEFDEFVGGDDLFEWPDTSEIETDSELEEALGAFIDLDLKGYICYMIQLGLTRPAALVELKKIAASPCDQDQSLTDFEATYPRVWNCLHAAFSLMPSASRIAEHAHGMLRSYLRLIKAFSSMVTTDERQKYVMSRLYQQRQERRGERRRYLGEKAKAEGRLDNDGKPIIKRDSAKHEATLREIAMEGRQVFAQSKLYGQTEVSSRLTKDQLQTLRIGKIHTTGRMKDDMKLAENQLEKFRDKANDRRNPDKDVDDYQADADDWEVEQDSKAYKDYHEKLYQDQLKEIQTPTFLKAQTPQDLIEKYQLIFPGIPKAKDGAKGQPTKTNIIKEIQYWCKPETDKRETKDPRRTKFNPKTDINVMAAAGMEGKESSAALRRNVTLAFADKFSGKMDEYYKKKMKKNL